MCCSCGCCHPCAILQCQTFEETIISDRAEKEAKRRQLEQDALELKSILKVKGSKAEVVLLHQQLGVNNLHHRLCSGRKWPEKVGWCGVAQAEDRQSLSLSTGAGTKPAASCRFEKAVKGEKPVSLHDLGPCPLHQPHCMGDTGRVTGQLPCSCPCHQPDALSPDVDTSSITSTGPAAAVWARGSLLRLGSVQQTLGLLSCTRYPSKWFLLRHFSQFQLQAWWRGTMVRRNLGPYQTLKKIWEKRLSKQKEKGKIEKPGAKKKTR